MSYRKIGKKHPAYERVQALLAAGHEACDAVTHNSMSGCRNPTCWKNPKHLLAQAPKKGKRRVGKSPVLGAPYGSIEWKGAVTGRVPRKKS